MVKYAPREIDLYEGYEEVQDAGKLDDVVKKLKTFRQLVRLNQLVMRHRNMCFH